MSFIDKCFKIAINKLVTKHPQVATVEKKTLVLSLPYLGHVFLQTRTKLMKSFKVILNCYKLQIVFKSQRNLTNVFRFKDHLPFNLVFGVVYKCTCEKCNLSYYNETDRHLKVKSGEHTGISSLTFGKVKPSKESAICDHLLNCNNIPSLDEFTILAYGHHQYIVKIKESLLIKHGRPVLNKKTSSTKMFLFENNQNFEQFYYTIILLYHLMFVTVIITQVMTLFEIEVKNLIFIVKQFFDNECSITLKTLENKI